MELTELCKELNNWFDYKKVFGTFTIEDGVLTDDLGLRNNQYYRIIGSIFNDGVHKYGDENDALTDEAFDGAVWAMAIPPEVIALIGRINDWEAKYGESARSPYTSESFGGYSYSKNSGTLSGGTGNGSGDVLSAFAGELNRWRKV